MLRVVLAESEPRLLVNGFKPHFPQEPSEPFGVDLFALSSQPRGHPSDAPAGMLRVLLVRDLNHQQVPCRFPAAFSKESTFIPIGKTHALENHGIIPLGIIEEKSRSYLGEDDIVRVEDRFGRLSE